MSGISLSYKMIICIYVNYMLITGAFATLFIVDLHHCIE